MKTGSYRKLEGSIYTPTTALLDITSLLIPPNTACKAFRTLSLPN